MLSRISTGEKALQPHCMQLKGQQSKLGLVSLEKRQPEQATHERSQQIKEYL